jgi:hypothetical protein
MALTSSYSPTYHIVSTIGLADGGQATLGMTNLTNGTSPLPQASRHVQLFVFGAGTVSTIDALMADGGQATLGTTAQQGRSRPNCAPRQHNLIRSRVLSPGR